MISARRTRARPICRSALADRAICVGVLGRGEAERSESAGWAAHPDDGRRAGPRLGDHLLDAPRGVDVQHGGPAMVEPSEPGRLTKAIPVKHVTNQDSLTWNRETVPKLSAWVLRRSREDRNATDQGGGGGAGGRCCRRLRVITAASQNQQGHERTRRHPATHRHYDPRAERPGDRAPECPIRERRAADLRARRGVSGLCAATPLRCITASATGNVRRCRCPNPGTSV
jgi:hypothetical protein